MVTGHDKKYLHLKPRPTFDVMLTCKTSDRTKDNKSKAKKNKKIKKTIKQPQKQLKTEMLGPVVKGVFFVLSDFFKFPSCIWFTGISIPHIASHTYYLSEMNAIPPPATSLPAGELQPADIIRDSKTRFVLELEFVSLLANPHYLQRQLYFFHDT